MISLDQLEEQIFIICLGICFDSPWSLAHYFNPVYLSFSPATKVWIYTLPLGTAALLERGQVILIRLLISSCE